MYFSLKSANECSNGIVLPSLKELTEDIEEDTDQSETSSVSEWPLSIRNELRDLVRNLSHIQQSTRFD